MLLSTNANALSRPISLLLSIMTAFYLFLVLLQCPGGGNCEPSGAQAMDATNGIDEEARERLEKIREKIEQSKGKVGEKVEETLDGEDMRTFREKVSDSARSFGNKASEFGQSVKEKMGQAYESTNGNIGEKVEETLEGEDTRAIHEKIRDAAKSLGEKVSELGQMMKEKSGEKYAEMKEAIGQKQQENEEGNKGVCHDDGADCDPSAPNAYGSVAKSAGQAAEYARQRAADAMAAAREYLQQAEPEVPAEAKLGNEKGVGERVLHGLRRARDAVTDAVRSMGESVRDTLGGVMPNDGGEGVMGAEVPLKHDVPETPVVYQEAEDKSMQDRVMDGVRAARDAVGGAAKRAMHTLAEGIGRAGDDAAVVP